MVCEKPLCMTLEEADRMIDTCKKRGVLLMYAEELFFTPKYLKVKEMADQGAFGKVYMVKQMMRIIYFIPTLMVILWLQVQNLLKIRLR